MSLAQPPAADSLAAPVQVGTRASPLALVQTRAFIALITAHAAASGTIFAEQHIRTTGDAVQNRKLAEIGGPLQQQFKSDINQLRREHFLYDDES